MPSLLRRQLEASLAVTHSRHAIRIPQTLATIGEPAQWLEPMACREDAISEARRIAEEDSAFGNGFAWQMGGRWYAADWRPQRGMMNLHVGEIVTVDVGTGEQGEEGSVA